MIRRSFALISFLLFLFLIPGNSLAQRIDSTVLTDRIIQFHILDLFRLDAPGLKVSFEHQYSPARYVGVELGAISDFNATIFVMDQDERGMFGSHVSLYHLWAIPVTTIDYTQLGIRVNYNFDNREFKSWIYRDQASYLQRIQYHQYEHDIGLYLKWANTRRYPNGFSYTLGINPGIVYRIVNTDLPENSSVNRTPQNLFSDPISFQRDAGHYLHPHLYLELNLGYSF